MKNSSKAKQSPKTARKSFSLNGVLWAAPLINYQKPIHDGFVQMMSNGILAGYNIDSMKVKVIDEYYAVDSKPIAFELVREEGFRRCSLQPSHKSWNPS